MRTNPALMAARRICMYAHRRDGISGGTGVSKNRLEAFSDGVIAVAITLLALDLSVPGPGHGSLLTLVGNRWPEFAAYAVSFLLIGIIWVNHHARFNQIAYVDRTLLFLNLVLLLFVVLIPFATATVAAYLTSDSTDLHTAMALYAVVLEGMALSFGGIFEWSLGEGRSTVQVPRSQRRQARIRTSIGEVVYVIVFVVAFISAPIALAITGLTGIYYVFAPLPRVKEDLTGISE